MFVSLMPFRSHERLPWRCVEAGAPLFLLAASGPPCTLAYISCCSGGFYIGRALVNVYEFVAQTTNRAFARGSIEMMENCCHRLEYLQT